MKKYLVILAVMSTISLSANAKDNGDDCNGRGSCSGSTTPSNNSATAIGVGVGIAGASSYANGGSIHSNIENSVKNTNTNSNINRNSNVNSIHNSTKNYNDNYNDNYNSNTQKQKQNQTQGQSQSTENSNNASQSVTVNGDTYKAPDIPVSSAYAPPAFPTAPCRVALSAGLSLMNIGGSFGGSTLDTQCDLRATAQAFAANGDPISAEYLLCSLDAAKNLPKCRDKIKEMGLSSSNQTTQQTQISSIIK